jgi:Predicted NTPase (NACHT family)
MAEEVTKAVLSAAARSSLEALVRKLGAKSEKDIDPAHVMARIQYYAAQLDRVKTLLSPETQQPIDTFYCAPRLVAGRGRAMRPSSSSDFKEDHVLVEGVAGQGKSVLLRYLCSRAIKDEGKIALYFELRRLDKNKPIITMVMEALQDFGLPGNTKSLKHLAVEKDVELYLDGFDELDHKSAEKIDRDINFISIAHPFIKVFLSSRPHVGLAKNSSLAAYRIERLDRSDIHRLIRKLSPEADLADSLIKNLDFHQGRALELLETPLLVTLLVSQYTQTQQLPEQLAEFYDNIFSVLFERHDSFKAPYVRPKLLGLTTHAYRKIFQMFCYGSLFVSELTTDIALELAGWAMEHHGLQDADPESFLRDICNTSSLINEEGGHWSFIHNSVQEFYAASYLLVGSDEELKDRAEELGEIPNVASRDQIFRFASEINKPRFVQFVKLPFFEELTRPLAVDSNLEEVDVSRWLSAHVVSISFDKNSTGGGKFFTLRTNVYGDSPLRMFAPDPVVEKVSGVIECKDDVSDKVRNLMLVPHVSNRLVAEVRARVHPYLMQRRDAEKYVEENEKNIRSSNRFLKRLVARRE